MSERLHIQRGPWRDQRGRLIRTTHVRFADWPWWRRWAETAYRRTHGGQIRIMVRRGDR